MLAGCRATAGAAVCPRSLPRTSTRYRGRAIHLSPTYEVFDIAAGGPYPGITGENAPPRFAHVVIKAGDLSDGFYFRFPASGAPQSPSAIAERRRASPILLGARAWGGNSGVLVLAPSFPAGGIDGDHLIFRWSGQDEDVAVSLHAWRPLADAEATLRALVESIG